MLSTDTTWEVVQSFLNVPGMKGVALIDGRSRPYFQGIERVLNSQQREALAKGVWQVLETIPDDFESFEFQFAGTQVYIHKLSQEQILLVLTHDNLIYPDYFDAFSRLRTAFSQDGAATMEVFQRLLGARNTKVTPLNLSDVANGNTASGNDEARDDAADADAASRDAVGHDAVGRDTASHRAADQAIARSTAAGVKAVEGGRSAIASGPGQELPTLEIPAPEIPSGSADYAVAADTEITDVSTAAVEPDAPANPAQPEQSEPAIAMPLGASEDAEDFSLDSPPLPDFAATDAGLPEIDGEAHASLPDLSSADAEGINAEVRVTDAGLAEAASDDIGAIPETAVPETAVPETAVPETRTAPEINNAANLFAASLSDANALVGRSAKNSGGGGLTSPGSQNGAKEPSEAERGGKAEQDAALPSLDSGTGSASFPNGADLLATSPSAQQANRTAATQDDDHQADLAALMDTLSLGEEDFEQQGGTGSSLLQPSSSADLGERKGEATLPDLGAAAEAIADQAAALPQIEVEDKTAQALDPWDDPEAVTAALNEALAEDRAQSAQQSTQPLTQDEQSLLAVTPLASPDRPTGTNGAASAANQESLLNNRLDAVALDDDIEIDDLFGYEDSATGQPDAPAEAAPAAHDLLESYVESLNALGEFSAHYLGRAVIVNYWRTSRPGDEWLKGAFAIERSANSIRIGPDYAASRRSPVTDGQEAALQTWAEQFVKRCSKVIRDFPQLAQQSLSEEQFKMLDL